MKQWFTHWKFERRRRTVEKWLNDPKSGASALLESHAQKMALLMVTNWLDRKRICHCMVCPSTETLLSYQGKYWCKGHYHQRTQEDAQKAQQKTVCN